MDRFTYRSDGIAHLNYEFQKQGAIEELADYEDTGLSPQEIMEAEDRRHNCKIECLLREYNNAVEELKRYKEAEEQGRLVRLPCKVGDLAYVINIFREIDECRILKFEIRDCIAFVEYASVKRNIGLLASLDKIGNGLYLTREEAETALRDGAQGTGDGNA